MPADYGDLVGTGVGLGVVHVLSGPDHLSALATLSVDGRCKAFWHGIRWGLGHSLGLILVAIIFISLQDDGGFDLDKFSSVAEIFVGAFMVLLGLLGLRRARMDKARKVANRDGHFVALVEDDAGTVPRPAQLELVVRPAQVLGADDVAPPLANQVEAISVRERDKENSASGDTNSGVTPTSHRPTSHRHTHRHGCFACCTIDNPRAQRCMALLIGLVHGVAGPGGILGVLPAVQLADWGQSSCYLGAFCITSIFVMGCFAAFYGELTARIAERYPQHGLKYALAVFSAVFSLTIGVLWLVLSATGQLSAVFG